MIKCPPKITKIGLEIHLRLKSVRKLFSTSLNRFNNQPNQDINSYDLAHPGTLPQLNPEAVQLGVQTCFLFGYQITDRLEFDRKNYYYFDLPRSYQITQFRRPLGKNGTSTFLVHNQGVKTIRFLSAHLEEDTAKILHRDNQIFADYNRAGASLLELVTAPDFHNAKEVVTFLEWLIWTVRLAQVSDAKFEEGSIRVDVNLSQTINGVISPITEIKNLNSLKNIEKAINQETAYQLTNFTMLKQSCTKMFDETRNALFFLRDKFTQIRYFFMAENNLAPIQLSSQLKHKWTRSLSWLIDFRLKFLQIYPQLTEAEEAFIFDDNVHLFYFCLLMHFLDNDKKVVLLFLKQILTKIFSPIRSPFMSEHRQSLVGLLQTNYQNAVGSVHHYLPKMEKAITNYLAQQKDSTRLSSLSSAEITTQINNYWKLFQEKSKFILPAFFLDLILSQKLFLNFELIILLLRLYQQKKLTFSIVEETFRNFHFCNRSTFANIEGFLLSYFGKSGISSTVSKQIEQFLAQLLQKDPKIFSKYLQKPDKVCNYLLGQIYRHCPTVNPRNIAVADIICLIKKFFLHFQLPIKR